MCAPQRFSEVAVTASVPQFTAENQGDLGHEAAGRGTDGRLKIESTGVKG